MPNALLTYTTPAADYLESQLGLDETVLDGRRRRATLLARELVENNPTSVQELQVDAERYARLNQTADRRESSAARNAAALLAVQGLLPASPGYERRLEFEKRALMHFPVLMISAPHIDQAINAHFPGEPTPLLYAIAPTQQLARLELFPSLRIPNVNLLHGHVFDDAFRIELAELLAQEQPWVVGISNMAEGHHNAIEIARMIKQRAPRTVVILGGSHEDGTNPEGFARDAHALGRPMSAEQRARLERLRTLGSDEERELIDFVVCGDGPYLLLELLAIIGELTRPSPEEVKKAVRLHADALRRVRGSGELFFFDREQQIVQGLSFRGEPLDRETLPFIDRRYSKCNRYACFNSEPTAQIMWNDGCVEVCTYCHEAKEHLLYGVKKIRPRTAESVLTEIKRIVGTHGVRKVFFDDSTFTQYLTPTHRLLDLLIACRPQFGPEFEWGCQTTITRLDPVLVEKMADAGCTYIYFGLEGIAPDPAQVTKARRTVTNTNPGRTLPLLESESSARSGWFTLFQSVVSWCERVRIHVGTSLQFGLGECHEDIVRMFNYLRELHRRGTIPDHCVALNMNAIYPGTEQYWSEVIVGGKDIDYRKKLSRHLGFETQHDNCPQPVVQAELIYQEAKSLLGRALIGHRD